LPFGSGSFLSLPGFRLAQNLEKTRHFWLRGPVGSPRTLRKLDTSGFEATWLEKTRLEVTYRSLRGNLAPETLRKLGSKSLRG
jgi:hypothetical protein